MVEEAETAVKSNWPKPSATRIMAVANQKGGVGKSTSTVNLAAWLALEGARVLVVDLDPQANATTGLGVDPHRVSGNIYQVIVEGKSIEDAIEATSVRNLFCVPSNIDLAGAEIELVPAFSRELKLKKALEEVESDFDYVLIDCPPSLGLLTINALAAAGEAIVPIQCEYYALEGLGQLLQNITLIQSNLNPGLSVSAIVLTMYDGRTKLSEQVAAEVRSHFPGKVCEAVVPRSVRLSEAPSFGQPIALYAPTSKGSLAYRAVAEQLARQTPGEVLPDRAPPSFGEAGEEDSQAHGGASQPEGAPRDYPHAPHEAEDVVEPNEVTPGNPHVGPEVEVLNAIAPGSEVELQEAERGLYEAQMEEESMHHASHHPQEGEQY